MLCEPLCFLVNKFGKLHVNLLKSVVTDFYDVNAISEAKKCLLDAVGKLSTVDKLPHIANHHSNVDRIKRDVDDIIAVLVFLDEHGLHNSLPRYVCANPDNLPSVRLFDGDLHILLTRLEKLENKLARLDSTLADMTGEVRAIRCAAVGVSSTNQATVASIEQHDLQHGYQPYECISTEVPTIATTITPMSTLGMSVPAMHVGQGLESKSTDTNRNLSHDVPKSWAARTASTWQLS